MRSRLALVAILFFACKSEERSAPVKSPDAGVAKTPDAGAAKTPDAGNASTLQIGDACKGRTLPGRTEPLPQVVGPTSELLPDGAVRPIDAGIPKVDPTKF